MTFALAKPQKRVESRAYREFIRDLPCIQCAIEGRTTFGCDPAHVSYAFPGWSHRGKGTKVDDTRCVPSCRLHHDEQHADGNERRYWARYRLSPVDFCAALEGAYPDITVGAQVVREFAHHARRGLPSVIASTGPVTRRAAGPVAVTITAHLASIPADDHGNIAVLIPREVGLKDAPCDVVWVAPIAVAAPSSTSTSAGRGRV